MMQNKVHHFCLVRKERYMKGVIAILVLALAGCVGSSASSDRLKDEEKRIKQEFNGDLPWELVRSIKKTILGASAEELDNLVADPNCRIALAAAWERVLRTVPEQEEPSEEQLREWSKTWSSGPSVSPDRSAMSRFLGLLEGRIGVAIPQFWGRNFQCASGKGRNMGFANYEDEDQERSEDPGAAPAGADSLFIVPERKGDHLVLKQGSEALLLPAEDGGWMDRASVGLTSNMAYVALYHAGSACSYNLYALNRHSGKVVWSASVWGDGNLIDSTGIDWHVVELRATDSEIVVFGISGCAAYVEVFGKETGEDRCRFGTDYFAVGEE